MRPVLAFAVLAAPLAAASTDPLPAPPVMFPSNYERVAIGQFGALEAGAVVARIRGSEAGWYNPAGLPNDIGANLNASANVLQMTSVQVDAIGSREGTTSFKAIPSFFGSATHLGEGEPGSVGSQALGFSVSSPTPWSQSFDRAASDSDEIDVAFSSLGNSDVVIPALSWGYVADERWRVGAALEVHYYLFEVSAVQTIAGELDGELLGITQSLIEEFWGLSAGFTLGVQYGDGEGLHLGALLRSPQWSFLESGKVHAQAQLLTPDGDATAVLFDNEPDVHYRRPWQLSLGLAWVDESWELEWDIGLYAAISAYSPLSSDADWIITERGESGSGQRSYDAVEQRLDPGFTVTTSLGARYLMGNDLWLQGGLRYDPSADPGSGLEVDLWHLTGGVSMIKERVMSSVGLHVGYGEQTNADLKDIAGIAIGSGKVEYLSLGLVVSSSFYF